MNTKVLKTNLLFGALLAAGMQVAVAETVSLQNASATFSQDIEFSVGAAIDGVLDETGWAIYPGINSQAAVFETTSDKGFVGGSILTFVFSQLLGNFHNIGSFKLSTTSDARSTFADGLASGGDVSANWTPLIPTSFFATSGATSFQKIDGSTLISGANSFTDTYTITAATSLSAITGFRLDVLPDSTLPAGGPGRASNGNFVLSEFQVTISPVPEQGQFSLLALGLLSMTVLSKVARRKSS